jgi:hypothetical protein
MSAMESRHASLRETGLAPRALHGRPRPGLVTGKASSAVEIVRHVDGPVEVKISGLIDTAERRIRQWQGVAASLFLIMVVGAALAIVVVALRWDYERGRAMQVLQTDLQMARARERCWEALARFTPRTTDDVVTPAKRDAWVARCTNAELERVNVRR